VAKKVFIKPGNGSLFAAFARFLEEVQERFVAVDGCSFFGRLLLQRLFCRHQFDACHSRGATGLADELH